MDIQGDIDWKTNIGNMLWIRISMASLESSPEMNALISHLDLSSPERLMELYVLIDHFNLPVPEEVIKISVLIKNIKDIDIMDK